MLSLEDFGMCMAPLTRHWPEPTLEQWADYRAILGHLDAPVLAAAVLQVLASHVYPTFPKPAVILAAAASVTKPPTRTGDEAWGDVMRAVNLYGYIKPPGEGWTFKDARVLAAVEQIGWKRICLEEDKTMQWQFIHAYNALSERENEAAAELPAVAQARQLAAGERMRQLTAAVGVRPRASGRVNGERDDD